MDLGLAGRVAIVTGSSRGIGRATAQLLAAEGARVIITFRHDRERAEAVAASIRKEDGEAFAVPLDLSAPESIRDTAEFVIKRWGRVDVLVNNALKWSGTPADIDNTWRDLVRTNFEGAYAMIDAVVPSMRTHKWGRIVNVSSTAASDGMPGFAWYAASKAALHGLTRTLARELGSFDILINNVVPGGTMTSTVFDHLPPAVLLKKARELPLGRLPRPEEVAATIVFLTSAMNTTITGEDVRASGGRQ